MAFLDLEDSIEDGRPISFYQFVLGSVAWRYTSAEEAITVGGHTWQPAAITDDGSKQTGEAVNDVLTIDAPSWIGPAQVFMSASPSKSIQVTIFAKHEGDAELVAIYVGDISQINYPLPAGMVKISCETLGASMQREGLRLAWQRPCPYALYDPVTCKVNKALWGTTFVVQTIDGDIIRILLSTARATDFYNNGFLEWAHPIRGTETLAIDTYTQVAASDEGTIALLSPAGDLFVGATGTAYPGCNFTPASCTGFANYDNYGGVPDMPGKSPFDGNPFF